MKKFLKIVGGVVIAGVCVFAVGATTYSVSPEFKSWVDTDIIKTVPEDESLEGFPAPIDPEISEETGDESQLVLILSAEV